MSNQERKKNFQEPWWIRRAAYIIVGAVLLGLAGFGFIDEGQVDAVTTSPLLGTLVAWIAAAKTNPGSDSTVTAADVEVSRHARAELDAQLAALQHQVQEQVQGAVTSLTDYLPARIQDAVRSLYEQPYGDHELTNPAPEPEPDPASDVVEYYRRASGWGRVDGED